MARDKFTCQYCGRSAPDVELHVDHLVPVARGGQNSKINLLASCADCNLSKQAQPLSIDIIKQKQESIIERTRAYEKFLVEHPLESKAQYSNHLMKRPTIILSQHKNIDEPLKNKSLHPEKRHALNIYVSQTLQTYLSYGRLDQGGWVFDVNKCAQGLTPLTSQQYLELFDENTYELVDVVEESFINVCVHRNKLGFHIVITTDDSGSMAYGFWSPLRKLEVAIEIEPIMDSFPLSDDEMKFYSM